MRSKNKAKLNKLALALMLGLATIDVSAQSTSSAVSGLVVDESGSPVTEAEVVITHVESNTVSRVTTDASGRYTARGLRVGGPYVVTVMKNGMTDVKDGVYLSLTQSNQLNSVIRSESVTALDSVVVTGVSTAGSDLFSSTKMGAGTSISRETLDSLPSASGNIQDYIRLDPRVSFVDKAVGSISAGGQNPRYNAIRVDGVSVSDTIGVESNSMPTRRQPVSMEAIEAVNVDLSSYDVSISGATGAVVDAVTKSGGNSFSGSVYSYYRDGDWFGDDPNGNAFTGFQDELTYGATFGGPIVKDKLYFFLNYEKFDQSAPGADLAASAVGLGRIPVADVERAADIIRNQWGWDPGSFEGTTDTGLEEVGLKIDWNISDYHRASFRYSQIDQASLQITGMNANSASLSSNWYQLVKEFDSYGLQVFSGWSERFSTEFKLSYRDYAGYRVTTPEDTPLVQIAYGAVDSSGVGGIPRLNMGADLVSQHQRAETGTWNAILDGLYSVGNHDLKFGVEAQRSSIYNLFGSRADGQYVFNSVDDLANDNWSYFIVHEPRDGDISNLAANYTYESIGLYLQDSWYVNDRLTLTAGIRADTFQLDSVPERNQLFEDVYGFDNSYIRDGKFLFQPRFGFNYTFASDRPLQIRGGLGLFQGETPKVWINNVYENTGFNFQVNEVYASGAPSPPRRMNITAIAPDFELPSVWKANLAVDAELPWNGLVASAEVLATDVKSALQYERLDLGDPTGLGPDGRRIYWANPVTGGGQARANRHPQFGDVFMLTSSDLGYTRQFTVSLQQPWRDDSDWSWSLAYTRTQANEINGLVGGSGNAGFSNNAIFQVNEQVSATSRYGTRDRLSGSLTWRKDLFGGNTTEVGFFYDGRSGLPFSYVFGNDTNGDAAANDLFYVPAGRGDVLFTGGAAMEERFFNWLASTPDLARYAGTVVPRNSARNRWVNTVDLRIKQELPGFFDNHKSEVWLDLNNIGNLINKDWGHVYTYGYNDAMMTVARYAGLDPATGRYVYDFTNAEPRVVGNSDLSGTNTGISQWSVVVGFRYKF